MRKITLIALSLTLSFFSKVGAQDLSSYSKEQLGSGIAEAQPFSNAQSGKTNAASTFSIYYDRSTQKGLYVVPSSTIYYTGTSGAVGTLGINYDNSGTVNITELLVMFGSKVMAESPPKTFKAYLYTAGSTDSLPSGSPLATTSYSTLSVFAPESGTINTTIFTHIPFSGPVSVTGNFVAAVQIDTATGGTRDRLRIVTSFKGDGLNERRMCAYPVPGAVGGVGQQWYNFNDFWATTLSSPTFTLDADAMIIPVVQGETTVLGINEIAAKSSTLSLKGHYPSPANKQINIDYILDKSSDVKLKIFDLTGRTIYQTSEDNAGAGMHKFNFDIDNLSNGAYYYTISNSDGSITSKFVVSK
jgi:hypothetical protein